MSTPPEISDAPNFTLRMLAYALLVIAGTFGTMMGMLASTETRLQIFGGAGLVVFLVVGAFLVRWIRTEEQKLREEMREERHRKEEREEQARKSDLERLTNFFSYDLRDVTRPLMVAENATLFQAMAKELRYKVNQKNEVEPELAPIYCPKLLEIADEWETFDVLDEQRMAPTKEL